MPQENPIFYAGRLAAKVSEENEMQFAQ